TVVERVEGTIESTENWGRRRLAYEIAGHREGSCALHVINGPGELNSELDRRLRAVDVVIRHLSVRVDEELAAAERLQTRRKAGMVERRTRRGLPPEPDESERRRGRDDDDSADDDMPGVGGGR